MNDLVDRIADGTAELLGIDDICRRLGVSRTTLDRWVQNGRSKRLDLALGLPDLMQGNPFREALGRASGIGDLGMPTSALDESSSDKTVFPEPDIRIGNSPKWEMSTFKEWLKSNAKK
ncbi:TPA: helix-turn-helix transcriptional regulator [Enterobacter asburiae]|uniref:helix-turn-helix transcriptional regulator n=1 Tax=Klebsiella pneumoniae TaxID=573 RepID=UPI0022323E2B|nr:helix-turn-helix domain-containing protein [Klebsiella pneumoniae]MDM8794385.1 helix-turn-helix domain-containing protein [Klebsiella pneumoniae]